MESCLFLRLIIVNVHKFSKILSRKDLCWLILPFYGFITSYCFIHSNGSLYQNSSDTVGKGSGGAESRAKLSSLSLSLDKVGQVPIPEEFSGHQPADNLSPNPYLLLRVDSPWCVCFKVNIGVCLVDKNILCIELQTSSCFLLLVTKSSSPTVNVRPTPLREGSNVHLSHEWLLER